MRAIRRVDRIREFLERNGGRVRMREIHHYLRQEEGDDELSAPAIYAAIRNENDRAAGLGQAPPFRTKREGEAHGWVSLNQSGRGEALGDIETRIHEANAAIDGRIREMLRRMGWRTFESEFLTILLEKLGFQDVEVTQATRDGGVDARVAYRRGIVSAKALVSAKHWGSASVAVNEVRNIRGIKGDEDTAIIVTSGTFTRGATDEASPSAGQRLVYLIDGNEIVNACKQYGIGVRRKVLPELLEIDEQFFQGTSDEVGDDADELDELEELSAREGADSEQRARSSSRRLREEMLGDSERGLSVQEVAGLTGHAESTVTQYLYNPDRRRSLFEKIRQAPDVRQRALQIVGRKRQV